MEKKLWLEKAGKKTAGNKTSKPLFGVGNTGAGALSSTVPFFEKLENVGKSSCRNGLPSQRNLEISFNHWSNKLEGTTISVPLAGRKFPRSTCGSATTLNLFISQSWDFFTFEIF